MNWQLIKCWPNSSVSVLEFCLHSDVHVKFFFHWCTPKIFFTVTVNSIWEMSYSFKYVLVPFVHFPFLHHSLPLLHFSFLSSFSPFFFYSLPLYLPFYFDCPSRDIQRLRSSRRGTLTQNLVKEVKVWVTAKKIINRIVSCSYKFCSQQEFCPHDTLS